MDNDQILNALADDLIVGQKNTDEMRRRINQLVGTIKGLAQNLPNTNEKNVDLNHRGNGLGWNIYIGKPNRVMNVIEDWVEEPNSKKIIITLYNGKDQLYHCDDKTIYSKRVEEIYDARGLLVGGMREAYPLIAEMWEPFVRVAQKQL